MKLYIWNTGKKTQQVSFSGRSKAVFIILICAKKDPHRLMRAFYYNTLLFIVFALDDIVNHDIELIIIKVAVIL